MPRLPRDIAYPMPQEMTLPERAVDWTSRPQSSALLIHDLQRHFLAPFAAGQAPVAPMLANIIRLRDRATALGIPVIYTAQPANQDPADRALLTDFWGPGLTGNAEGAQIIEELAPRPEDIVLTKWRYSAFERTELAAKLKAIDRNQLIITGVYAHIGCQVTAVEAFMRDVQPFLIADAVADFSLGEHQDAINWVAGRAGVVQGTASLLADWSQPAVTGPDILQTVKFELAPLLYLEPTELALDDDLLGLGLDSIRMMELVERLRTAGIETSFEELASAETLEDLVGSLR